MSATLSETFEGHEVFGNRAVVYDDFDAAVALAARLGTVVTHSQARAGTGVGWRMFSIVELPADWRELGCC